MLSSTQNRRNSPILLLSALLFLAFGSSALAQTVTLEWDPNAETDLAGYKVYYGTAPGTYGAPITIGTQPTYTFSNLAPGTWYFAVTAFNSAGLESGFSNEVSTTVSGGAGGSACDLNGDSGINVLDLQVLINAILGVQGATGRDLNGDGRVDVLDLQILGNVILGIRSCPIL